MKKSILFILLILLNSCSILDGAYNLVKDNVEVTWKFDKSKDLKIVDSIVVISKPVYWITDISEFQDGEEKIIIKDGYSIWHLRTGNKLRTEVIKLDSTIYIYKINK